MTAGGLIGIERTYHGHPAGFRTHILVCLTSCMLMLAAMHQATWAFVAFPGQTVVIDPTRMPVLAILRFLDARLPQIGVVDIILRWRRDAAPSDAAVRDLLKASGMRAIRVGHSVSNDGATHEHCVKARGPIPLKVDVLVESLSGQAGLASFSVMPRDD